MEYYTDVNLTIEKLKSLSPSHLSFITGQIDTLLKMQTDIEKHMNAREPNAQS